MAFILWLALLHGTVGEPVPTAVSERPTLAQGVPAEENASPDFIDTLDVEVVDAFNRRLPGVRVDVTSPRSGRRDSRQTDANGHAQFTVVIPFRFSFPAGRQPSGH